jgi:hypothetical protein
VGARLAERPPSARPAFGLTGLLLVACLVLCGGSVRSEDLHQGVATCAGSTCHGRQAGDGAVVRQNELVTWQDPSSSAGAHSRAWRTLQGRWAQRISTRLGLGDASRAPACLGCHSDPAPARGPRFQVSDGVGCEACHGGSERWLASHAAVGATHAGNVARGMTALNDPRVAASVCLDCHLGSERPNQFVSHRMMSAGHPRLTFELDLFNAFQRHHDEDADYSARKPVWAGTTVWAVGQALALERSLSLFSRADRGVDGQFPEFVFYDCHSCHRAISDGIDPAIRSERNPGRAIPWGAPPWNDENLILLGAAARPLGGTAVADRLDADTRAFHLALAQDRPAAVAAARALAGTSRELAGVMAGRGFNTATTLDLLRSVLSDALAPRFTDYTGGAQAVMAVDTLLNALVRQGAVPASVAAGLRPEIEAAYAATRDPNDWRPAAFRQSLTRVRAALDRAT